MRVTFKKLILVLSSAMALLFCGQGMSQDISSPDVAEISLEQLASSLFHGSDLIAVGRFAPHAERGNDLATLLGRSTEIRLAFRINAVYKGSVLPGSAVFVQLQSDMLAYPGTQTSRNEQRKLELEARREEMKRLDKEATGREERFRAGQIDRVEHQEELREFSNRYGRWIRETGELVSAFRDVGATHVSSFYDRDGAIHPDVEYLVAIRSIAGDPVGYSLGELGFGIMWGELAAEVRSEIEKLQQADASRGLGVGRR